MESGKWEKVELIANRQSGGSHAREACGSAGELKLAVLVEGVHLPRVACEIFRMSVTETSGV